MELSRLEEARKRIEHLIIKTPLIPIYRMERSLGFIPWLKLENMQTIGAFKIRGAMNAALNLSKDKLACGLITASSGNHGIAVAFAAKQLNTKALILLPTTVTKIKLDNIKALGAEVLLVDPEERIKIARELAQNRGMTFIHPFDNEDVIAGQASIGLEIMEQHPMVRQIVIPMGGGGLISGIALAVKQINPKVKIVGVETAAVPKFSENLSRSQPSKVSTKPSIADALLTNRPGDLTFQYVKKYVDEIIAVEETHLINGYRMLLNEGKILCEPSSSVGFGALLQEAITGRMEETVFVISGGNIMIKDIMNII